MDELKSKALSLYDSVVSSWTTLSEIQQYALLSFAAGGLLLVLTLLRIRRKRLAGGVLPRGTATEAVAVAPGSTWSGGLQRTRKALSERLQQLVRGDVEREQLFANLEELLISSDLGVKTSRMLLERLRAELKEASAPALRAHLHSYIREILSSDSEPEISPEKRNGGPLVIAVIGVNGVGKTTTIGKLAWQFGAQGKKVLIAACDTFRAAAEQQLQVWAERASADIVSGVEGAKPSTVAYDAVHKAMKERYDVLIVDTAGRLHTRVNLMNELQNVLQLIGRECPGAPQETILVVDASTGQNALQQAIDFNRCAPLSGIIVTKLDGTPKGGIVVAIKHELGVPIRYVGIGEQASDLKLFSADEFTDALFAEGEGVVAEEEVREAPQHEDAATEPRRVARRRRRNE